jgi:2-polyprenyl-6-methoxyphenol hydroxylase-like FAD-dependent oxidoreductase
VRKLLHITAVAVLACGLSQAASGASPPASHALSAYLAKVKPLNAAVAAAEGSWMKAKAHPKKGSNNTDPSVARKELIATLLHTSSALKRIVPSATLKNAHAAFISSLKLEARGADGSANRLRTRWRDAVVFQLHRAGLAVPRWVKLVRDPLV